MCQKNTKINSVNFLTQLQELDAENSGIDQVGMNGLRHLLRLNVNRNKNNIS